MKVNQDELANILGVEPRTIRYWSKAVPPIPVTHLKGKTVEYNTVDCIAWLDNRKLEEYKKTQVFTAEDKKLAEIREAFAKAELREIELAEKKETLVSADEVEEAWTNLIVSARTTLLGLGHKIAVSMDDGLTYDEKKTLITGLVSEALSQLVEDQTTEEPSLAVVENVEDNPYA